MERSCEVFIRKTNVLVVDAFRIGLGPRRSGKITEIDRPCNSELLGENVISALNAFKEFGQGVDETQFDFMLQLKKRGIGSWRTFFKNVEKAFVVLEKKKNKSVQVIPMIKDGAGFSYDEESSKTCNLESNIIGELLLAFLEKDEGDSI